MATEQRDRARILLNIAGVLLLVVAVAVVAGVAVATVALPGCNGCHTKDAAFAGATQATAHASAGASCVSCHVVTSDPAARAKFGFYEVFGMWLPLLDVSASDVALPRDEQCLTCHGPVMDAKTEARGLAVLHSACTTGRRCVDCHAEVGHGEAVAWQRGLSMADCAACHQQRQVSIECSTCHLGDIERTAASDPEFAITHGSSWEQTHGMGRMSSCALCHETTDCARCHGPGVPHAADFMKQHSAISQEEGATCLTCHDQSFCDSCHLTEMPHSKEFVTTHSDVVERDGQEGCLRCHTVSDCDTCHVKHVHPGGAVGNIPSPDRSDR